jgi:TRAP-type C4-dicarboxylate transport system permease small subunit
MIVKRNIALCIIFSMVTCGIYGIYWFVCLTNDTNTVSEEYDTAGGTALLLTIITCGIYGLFWAYKRGEKIDVAKLKRGIPAGNGGVLYLLLYIFGGLIAFALIQNELNQLADRNERTNY